MINVLSIIKETPLYVWAILAYVVAIGIFNLKDHSVTLNKLVFVPLIFIIWSLVSMHYSYGLTVYSFGIWLLGVAIGCGFGWLFAQKKSIHIIDRSKGLILIPGGLSVLMIMVSFFIFRYIRGAAFAMNPELINSMHVVVLDLVFSGILTGFFLGRVAKYMHTFFKK